MCKEYFHKYQRPSGSLMALVNAVNPEVRRKMLLAQVKICEEASQILKAEQNATNDTQKCTNLPARKATLNAMSSYKRDRRQQNVQKQEKFLHFKLQPPCVGVIKGHFMPTATHSINEN